MSIAGYNVKTTTIVVPDPTADATFTVFKAPLGGATLVAAYAAFSAAIAADATNKITVSLLDGGADGSGTSEMATRVGSASVGWDANELHALTISDYDVDEGDQINVKYDESGTVAPGYLTVVLHWVQGGT